MAQWHWRGLKTLVHDGVDVTTELIREGHASTARSVIRVTDVHPRTRKPARTLNQVRRLATARVLGAVKVVNRSVEVLTDAGLDLAGVERQGTYDPTRALPMRSDITKSADWVGDGALGLLNAAVGDHLSARSNALDLQMVLRSMDRYLFTASQPLAEAIPDPRRRVVVFVHGLGTTEWSWCLGAETFYADPAANFGSMLERDLGFTSLYVRYNSGRKVAQNAEDLSHLLERLVESYPVAIDELMLVGHSMGGLVTRQACHLAEARGDRWPERVRRVFYLGSPHHGAALAKLGHVSARLLGAVDLPATRIISKVLDGRSEGIKDLRHGVLKTLWGDTIPLANANHHFMAGTVTQEADHPVAHLIGDLLVRVPSASGPTETSFDVEITHHGGVLHFELQNHPAVYEKIREACA